MSHGPKPIPDSYTTVTPWIIIRGAEEFLTFIAEVLDAEELGRVYAEDGTIGHAEVRIGNAIVMLFDAREDWPDTPQFLRLYVDDAKTVLERALAAGCRSVTAVTELAFGDQVGRFADPWNNLWWVQERLEELTFEEMQKRMEEPRYVEGMRYVQASLDDEMSGRAAKHPNRS
jgi:uncharacterized glyoxalase superfamily protein PhnB